MGGTTMRYLALTAAGLLGLASVGAAADAPRLRELRTQTVNGVTYFHARFDRPADLWLPNETTVYDRERTDLAQEPRLVPQDEQTRDVAFVSDTFPNE